MAADIKDLYAQIKTTYALEDDTNTMDSQVLQWMLDEISPCMHCKQSLDAHSDDTLACLFNPNTTYYMESSNV